LEIPISIGEVLCGIKSNSCRSLKGWKGKKPYFLIYIFLWNQNKNLTLIPKLPSIVSFFYPYSTFLFFLQDHIFLWPFCSLSQIPLSTHFPFKSISCFFVSDRRSCCRWVDRSRCRRQTGCRTAAVEAAVMGWVT